MKKLLAICLVIIALGVLLAQTSDNWFPDIILTDRDGSWFDTRVYSTFANALTAAGTTSDRTMHIIREEAVDNDLTVPSNLDLHFLGAGKIVQSSGTTTINASVRSADKVIFSTTGTGSFDFEDGMRLRTSWFDDFDDAVAITQDDTVTLVVSDVEPVTTTQALGDYVGLEFEGVGRYLYIDSGYVLSNISDVKAGRHLCFLGPGRADFNTGVELKTSWFERLDEVVRYLDDSVVRLLVDKPEILLADITIQDTTTVVWHSGGNVITVNTSLNFLGGIEAGSYRILDVGAGNVSLSGNYEVNPSWFGVVADTDGTSGNGTDNSAMLQSCVDAMDSGRIRFPPGRYRLGAGITISEDSTISIEGSGKDNENGGTVLYADLSSGAVLLDFESFRWRWIKDISLCVSSGAVAVPTKFINIANGASVRVSHSQLERVRIIGNSDADGNIAIDIGSGDSVQGDNLSFRDVDIQKVNTGIKFSHLQVVGIEGSKLHFNTVKYCLAFTDSVSAPTGDGGGMVHFSGVQHTSEDTGTDETVVFIRAAGNQCTYTFTNLSTEKDAILLDASASDAAANQINVTLIEPRSSRNDRTQEILRIGPATVCNVLGGNFRTTVGIDSVVMTGTQDIGDSLLVMRGVYLEDSLIAPLSPFTIDADVNSFYDIQNCFKYVGSSDDVWTDHNFYPRSSARLVMPPQIHMPTAPTMHFKMPLNNNTGLGGDKRLIRHIPADTRIVKLIVDIQSTTATDGYFQVAMPSTNYVGRIDCTTSGIREIRPNDNSGGVGTDFPFSLDDPDLDVESEAISLRRSDDECLNASGYVIVEYVFIDSGVLFDVTP